jgi:hypothetical protein
LPERLGRSHRGQLLAGIGKRRAYRLVGRAREFPPTSLTALASVGIEDRLAFDAEVAGLQADHLGPTPSRQNECEEDGSVSPPGDGVGDHRKEPSHLVGAVSPGNRLNGSGSLDGVAGVADDQAHPDQEAVEGGQARDPRTDRG